MSQTIKNYKQQCTEISKQQLLSNASAYEQAIGQISTLKKDPALQDVNSNNLKEVSSSGSEYGLPSTDENSSR